MFIPLPRHIDHVYLGALKLPRCTADNRRGYRCEKARIKNKDVCVVHQYFRPQDRGKITLVPIDVSKGLCGR